MNFIKVKEPGYLHNNSNQMKYYEIIRINPSLFFKKNINKIIFKGINNKLVKNIILNNLGLCNILTIKTPLTLESINSIISKLRNSGYFNKIKAFYLLLNNYPYLIIQLELNFLIKEIVIHNSNKLKISNSYLTSIAKKQIGYPASLKLVNSFINHIKDWYYLRGYKWIQISYKKQLFNFNTLEVFIIESKIKNIQISCLNSKLQSDNQKEKSLILERLNIVLGEPLNFYNLELGIIKLKTQQPIFYCNYDIQYTKDKNLQIHIQYYDCQQELSYIFNRSIYFNDQLLELIHQQTYLNIHNFLNSFNSLQYFRYTITKYLSTKIFSSYFSYKNFILSNYFNINNKYKYNPFTVLQNYLKIRHSLNSLFNQLIIDIKKSEDEDNMILSYKYFKLNNNRYSKQNINIYIFRNIYKIKNIIIQSILQNIKYRKVFFDDYYNFYGVEGNLVYKLISNLSIHENVNIYNKAYQENHIFYFNEWNSIYKLFSLVYQTTINRYYKTYQKFIDYQILIRSNSLNFKQKLIPKQIWHFTIKACTPLILSFTEFNKNQSIKYNLDFQYSKIFNFSKNRFTALVNTIILQCELKSFGSLRKYKNFNKINSKLKHKYAYASLEYYIYKKYNICFFLFFNYQYPLNQYFWNFSKSLIPQLKQNNHMLGTGLEISLPMNQIPIIQLKHSFSYYGIYRFYAKLYFK